jgi:hypothetical protein
MRQPHHLETQGLRFLLPLDGNDAASPIFKFIRMVSLELTSKP